MILKEPTVNGSGDQSVTKPTIHQGLAKIPSQNPNPVLRVARDGTILYANEASLPLLDVWGCQEGQPLPDDWCKLTLDVLTSGSSTDAEVEVEDRILSLTFAPVVEGHYVNVYGLDITGRVRAEWALGERVKELTCLYEVNRDMQEQLPIDELCRRVVEHLVPAMQFPEVTVPVIELDDRRFTSERYSEGLSHGLQAEIRVGGVARGQLRVYYAQEKPFLIPEEQNLINGVAEALGLWLERKRAEEALEEYLQRLEETVERRTAELRASEEKLRAQYKAIPVPTYTWQGVEDDFVLVDYNDAAVAITQGRIADWVGNTASEMYRDMPEVLEEFSRCLAEKTNIEREMSYRFRSTGESRHLAVKYAFVPPNLVLVHTEDVTERKRAEETLRASEERYRSLFDGVPVGLYRTTLEGGILDVNPALVNILGYPDQESLLVMNAANLYVDPEDRKGWRALIDLEGVVHGVEVQLRRYDGTTIWARHTARAIRDADTAVVYYEGAVEDITERKQTLTALMEAEKLAIAGRLAASLAHEINNPLQTVIGCLGLAEETLAEETLAEGGDVSRYLQVAHEELRRTANIVAQLRDLHRPSRPENREPTDVNALLEQVLDLSRKQCESHRIEALRAMADLPALPLVADQIKQVFLNLLLNAIEAMPQGGRLQVTTTYTSQPAGVRIAFTDSGGGIAPDVLPHVFEPFYSARPEGLGLGLFISRNIVKQHGGQVEVDSRVGEGTTFTVWLPA